MWDVTTELTEGLIQTTFQGQFVLFSETSNPLIKKYDELSKKKHITHIDACHYC